MLDPTTDPQKYATTEDGPEFTFGDDYWNVNAREIEPDRIRSRWLKDRAERGGATTYEFFGWSGGDEMLRPGQVAITGRGPAFMEVGKDRATAYECEDVEEFLRKFFAGNLGAEEIRVFRVGPNERGFGKVTAHSITDAVQNIADSPVGEEWLVEVGLMPRLEYHTLPEFTGF